MTKTRQTRARRRFRRVAFVHAFVLLAAVAAIPARGATPSAAAAVPTKYKAMYAQTAADLDAYAKAIHAMPTYATDRAAKNGFVELLAANGNRQTALLQPSTMTLVTQSLDAFKRLGVGGVVLGVKLPLLLEQYTSHASEYANFFAKVTKAAHARGLEVDTELGALFCGSVYAPDCTYTFGTTVASFAALTARQARIVIDTVRPDYVDLISEVDTEADLTDIAALQSVAGFSSFVATTLATIGPHGKTKLIAGAPSWFPAVYDRAIANSGIDAFAMHIYPATATTAANLVAVSRLANDAKLPIVADEVGLYKGKAGAGAIQAGNEQGARNCFSFWQPLDVKFARTTREWAAKTATPLVSVFWSWQAFAYSTWSPALDALTSAQIQGYTNQAALAAMRAHTFTNAGLAIVGRK